VVNLAAPWFVTPMLVTQGNALSTSPVLLAVVMALGFASLAGLVAGLRAYGQQPGWRPARVFFTLWIAVPVVVVVLAVVVLALVVVVVLIVIVLLIIRLHHLKITMLRRRLLLLLPLTTRTLLILLDRCLSYFCTSCILHSIPHA
jgi:hypothetical protein